MNANEVKRIEDALDYIEGCLRDFEGGISTIEETTDKLLVLLIAITERQNKTNSNKKRIDDVLEKTKQLKQIGG